MRSIIRKQITMYYGNKSLHYIIYSRNFPHILKLLHVKRPLPIIHYPFHISICVTIDFSYQSAKFFMSTVKLIGTPVTLWCIARGSITAFKVTAGTDNNLSNLRE